MSNPRIAEYGKATRLPVNRPHAPNGKHPNGYLVPTLRKLLQGKIPVKDKKLQALLAEVGLPESIATTLMLRLVLNGTEGETKAITEILERTDGKVPQKSEIEGEVKVVHMGKVKLSNKDLEVKIGD